MSIKDYGAFPVTGGKVISEGMTLRDYFAAHALILEARYDMSPEDRAIAAYKMADAMLLERKIK